MRRMAAELEKLHAMKKQNLATLLGIALVVALLSTGVFYGLFVSKLKSNDAGKTLVVAAKALEPGTVLASADLRTVPWSSPALPEGAFERTDEVAGKTLFGPLSPSEPVLSTRLAAQDGSGQSSGVPAGMRAISVHVSDSSGVLSMLRAGHKVDVQVLIPSKQDTAAQLRTVLQGLSVHSVSIKADSSSQGFNLPVVTLLAKPAEADILALADSSARIRLTLRNPLDAATRGAAALNLTAIMQGTAR
jgi:pilus assembly protein CpaB